MIPASNAMKWHTRINTNGFAQRVQNQVEEEEEEDKQVKQRWIESERATANLF